MSKNNKVEIAEFLTNNEPQIVAMSEASPDIAKAWSNVVKVLAERYGNIVVNTPEPTNEPITDFTECKIGVINYEISKIVQEKLFELGYEWIASGKIINRGNFKNIFIRKDRKLECTYIFDDLYNLNKNYKIISFADLGVSLKDLQGGALVRTKIHLIDEETSIKVQEFLFEKGFKWPNTGKIPVSGIKYLFLEENMELSFSNFLSTFEEDYPDWGVITPQDLGIKVEKEILAKNADLRNTKMKISNPQEMEAVQKELFKRGYKWLSFGNTPSFLNDKYLYVISSGELDSGNYQGYFDEQTTMTEITPEQLGVNINQPLNSHTPPQNKHTQSLNEKQFNEMTQEELLAKKQEIVDAMNLFDEEDVEYETLKIQLETLELFLD